MTKKKNNKINSFKDAMLSHFKNKNTSDIKIVPPKIKNLPTILKIISPLQDNIQKNNIPKREKTSDIKKVPNKNKEYLNIRKDIDNLKKSIKGIKNTNLITNNYTTNNIHKKNKTKNITEKRRGIKNNNNGIQLPKMISSVIKKSNEYQPNTNRKNINTSNTSNTSNEYIQK